MCKEKPKSGELDRSIKKKNSVLEVFQKQRKVINHRPKNSASGPITLTRPKPDRNPTRWTQATSRMGPDSRGAASSNLLTVSMSSPNRNECWTIYLDQILTALWLGTSILLGLQSVAECERDPTQHSRLLGGVLVDPSLVTAATLQEVRDFSTSSSSQLRGL